MRAARPLELAALVVSTVAVIGRSADAQTATVPAPSVFEIAPGLVWMGGMQMGTRQANETTAAGGSVGLFSTSTALDAGFGFEGRIGVRLTRVLQLEAGASYTPTGVTTTFSNDVEGGSGGPASEGLGQWIVEGGVVAHLTRWRFGRRTYPILTAGAGYLRQLHEGRIVANSGSIYEFGGGARTILAARSRGIVNVVGIRTEARVIARTGGVALDGGTHLSPAFSASLFFGF